MPYEKPWLSVDEQLALLTQRGLRIDNHAAASACLERIGYYRLSGYMYAFRQRSGDYCPLPKRVNNRKTDRIVLDEFRAGSSFQDCIELYVFDKKLRSAMLDALERIEIAIRVDIAHLLGKRNTFAYLSLNEFHDSFARRRSGKDKSEHEKWLEKQQGLIDRSREDFIIHNKNKTGLPLAIWIACEVWDFGAMSTIFKYMKQEDQDEISSRYGISNGRIFSTWLETFNYIRNVCAHHNRLWNRNIEKIPKLPPAKDVPWVTSFLDKSGNANSRCFLELMMLSHVLKRINPNSSWSARVAVHLKSFPNLDAVGLNLAGMGAPKGWEKLLTQ
jgi:abortive infection bacteriophage resistance protein